MRLLLTSMNCPKGEVGANRARHLDLLDQGADTGCDLVLLPEMSLTGYRPGAAIGLHHPAVTALVRATAHRPALCFGLVEAGPRHSTPSITQVVAADGDLVITHRKAHLGAGEDTDFGSRLVLDPAAPGLYGDRRATDEEWRAGFDWWRGSVVDDARRFLSPGQLLAVSTQTGATDDEDFPGWAALVGAGGQVIAELPDWREGSLAVDVAGVCHPDWSDTE